MSGDSDSIRITLAQLASQALIPNMLMDNPKLPLGWVLLKTFGGQFNPPTVTVQGFLAKGPIDAEGNIAAALAFGVSWQSFLSIHTTPFQPVSQIALPKDISGSDEAGKVLDLYATAYLNIRPQVWNVLGDYLGDLPLYICGMSLGGPIAQIAALDLRPGNTGPLSNQKAPDTQPPGYVFSTGNFSNPDFVTYFNTTVTTQLNIRISKTNEPIDLFPTQPEDSLYSAAGTVVQVETSMPKYDVPWLERGDVFYLQALGGTPASQPAQPGSFADPPAGFSGTLAHSFSLLVGAAYAFSQHPGTIVDTSPYVLKDAINANGVPFAYVFSSVTDVVVVVRGTITWLEFISLAADSSFVATSFNPDTQAQVHRGAYSVYTAPVSSSDNTTFQDKLEAAIRANLEGKKLWLAGHGFGGAVANIVAADYAMSSGKDLDVEGVYTYGANLFANVVFQQAFNTALKDKSYQVYRLNDTIPRSVGQQYVFHAVDKQVVLNGRLAVEESTRHALDGYIRLSNPQA
jgi:pimeloyl-ACP methyl ester carboxylesterase